MNYDGLVLAGVVDELDSRIVGGRVQKIRQHNASDMTLEIRAPGHTYNLLLSVDPKFARAYFTSTSPPSLPEPPNFCMLCRKHLEGGFVSKIAQVGLDRIMRLHIEHRDDRKFILILEIMGKHSNLILVDSSNTVLGAIKHIGSSVSRYRQVLPGREYMSPPGDKKDILSLERDDLKALCDNSPANESTDAVKGWLMETFNGFGPFLADEVAVRAGSNEIAGSDALFEELEHIRRIVKESRYDPVIITGDRGDEAAVYPIHSVQYPETGQHPRSSINEALDGLFGALVTRTLFDEEQTQTVTAIKRAAASRRQTLKSIERTLDESNKANRYKEIGELLIADMHSTEKGVKSVRLIDYYDPEMPEIDIPLDEKLTPQQNSERYFKRYQKARDAASTAIRRRDHIQKEVDELDSALQQAEAATTVDSLKELRATLTKRDLLRAEVVHREKTHDDFQGYRIRRVETPAGWEILYGENSQSNDYLTQRVARPNDVWLHARSITGAHVVIRTAGHSGDIPREVILEAAKVAAKNSDAKHSSLVPIDHTRRKYVRKPRGAAPGYVIYTHEKTIDINPRD